MTSLRHSKYSIRDAQPNEFLLLGELTVNAYASLPGMPAVVEQADYYEVLRDVAKRARATATRVFAAVSDGGELLGTVNFFADMSRYSSGGTASSVANAAGIRYLAVKPESRGSGIGRSLTAYCVDMARCLGKSTVILHTTKSMSTAWAMYQRMGFQRCAEIDFQQGALEVFGFRLDLVAPAPLFTVAPEIRESAHSAFPLLRERDLSQLIKNIRDVPAAVDDPDDLDGVRAVVSTDAVKVRGLA